MFKFVDYQGLGYNDVSLVPSIGVIESRTQIPIEGYRIVVAGMSSILCKEFLKEWMELPEEIRPLIHVARDEDSIENLKFIAENNLQDWVLAGVGTNTPEIEKIALELGYKNILLDIAHGGLPQLSKIYNKLRAEFGEDANLICGSVATEEQISNLDNMGWDTIRLGVGTGNVCSTKYTAGTHIGAFSEILNAKSYFGDEPSANILADGGFYQICDFAKALMAGAQFCMSGYVFTKCKNARLNLDGSHEYFGMSSAEKGIRKGKTQYDESFTKLQQHKELYSLYDLLMKIWGGIRSAISYQGFDCLDNAIGNGEFVVLKTPLPAVDW